jgi:hypothetical protein
MGVLSVFLYTCGQEIRSCMFQRVVLVELKLTSGAARAVACPRFERLQLHLD